MKRGDFIVIIALAVVALVGLVILFSRSPDPATAQIVIQVDGKDSYSIPLHQEGRDEYLDVYGVNGLTKIHLQDGRVRVVESACPDSLCIRQGWTNSVTKPLVCLPNRVMVRIEGGAEEGEIDLQ